VNPSAEPDGIAASRSEVELQIAEPGAGRECRVGVELRVYDHNARNIAGMGVEGGCRAHERDSVRNEQERVVVSDQREGREQLSRRWRL
jgi:hypothetical protein